MSSPIDVDDKSAPTTRRRFLQGGTAVASGALLGAGAGAETNNLPPNIPEWMKAPGEPTIYHMGDTDIFGDMALIAEIHKPDVVIVPIGDRFTMGPEVAALAVQRYFGGAKAAIPCHYASFPPLVPDADRFVAALDGKGVQVVVPHKTVGVTV